MAAQTEALLFAAARAQHVSQLIGPALAGGAVVVCDRFTDSSLAYQWGGRGLDRGAMCAVQTFATSGLQPDLKILLDLPVAVSLRRRLHDKESVNRLDRETVAFYDRVRDAYQQLVSEDPNRWLIVDADRAPGDVWRDVWELVSPRAMSGGEELAAWRRTGQGTSS
jgi:dTMP kinase